jgi:hypothetical protein
MIPTSEDWEAATGEVRVTPPSSDILAPVSDLPAHPLLDPLA